MTESELNVRIRRRESFLVASDGQFLGQLSSNPYLFEGVKNQYGSFGSMYSSTSIFNKYGRYGSEYSQLSPFNQSTQHPPRIFLRGEFVGYLSVNQFVGNRLDPHKLFDYISNNRL